MSVVKDITIFSPPTDKKTLTKTERTILFENLELDTGIPHYHFESFNELEDQLLDEERMTSDIPALILKQISTWTMPILKKKTSKEFNISVQLTRPEVVTNKDLSETSVVSSETQMEVIGVKFSNRVIAMKDITLHNVLRRATVNDRLRSGMFGIYAWKFDQYGTYHFFQHSLRAHLKTKELIVYFTNTENALKSLKLLKAYVDYFDAFYKNSYLFLNTVIQFSPYSKITQSKYVPRVYKKTIPFEKTPILQLMEKIYANKLTSRNDRLVILYDIMDGKLWNIYQFAKILGLDHKDVIEHINKEKQRQLDNKIANDSRRDDIIQKNKHYKKLFLARSLFYKHGLDELTAKELSVINITYEKDLEFSKHVKKNKCQHLKLLERVMQSYSSGKYFDKNAWEELKKLIPQENVTDSLLKCSLCELLVLCPHHYDLFEFKMDRHKSDKHLRLLLLKKYADKSPIEDAYFCKICGEKLVKKFSEKHAAFIAGEKVHVVHTIDTMSNKIWKEVRGIISNQIEFNIVTDVNRLTTNITETIQSYIENEHTRLQNIKTNTPDIIQNTLFLYINIFAYASLIRIMSHHPNDMTFKKGFKGFNKRGKTAKGGDDHPSKEELKGKVNMKLLQGLFKTGLRLIVSTKASLIQKIPNISMDSIKPLFIKAYKTVSSLYIKTEEFNTELPPEYVASSVLYSYLYYIKKKHNPSLSFTDVRAILGVNLLDIPQLDNLLSKVKIPGQWETQYPDESPGFLNDKTYIDEYNKYAYASFLHFIKFIQRNLFMVGVFGSIKHEQHMKEYESLKKIENKFKQHMKSKFSNILYLYYNKQYGKYTYKPIDLSKIFCPDGRKHKFDIHIYEKEITRIEVSKKNIDEWMLDAKKNEQFRKLVKTDLKCSVCGTYLSKAKDSAGENSITNILNRNDEVVAFYNLYTFKCPVKNIHIFKDDTCTQCGATKNILFKKDLAFFKKYKGVFLKEFDKTKKKVIREKVIKKEEKKVYKDWVISQNPVSELSKITRTPLNFLINIGLIEGNDYERISSGEINPSENADDLDNSGRIIQLASYMTLLMIEYEMLRNGRITNSRLETFVSKWDDIDFSKFPDIYNEYNDQYKYYLYLPLSNDKMVNFILSSLTGSLVKLYRHFTDSKKDQEASMAFIKHIIDKIISSEKSISDPGILRGKLADVEDIEEGDAVEADYDDRDVDASEDYDPFSLENSDIDVGMLNDNMITGDD